MKYGLVMEGGCGGAGGLEPEYKILDETTCEKYNLPCTRQ